MAAKPPFPLEQNPLKLFEAYFDARLNSIANLRNVSGESYPDRVKELLIATGLAPDETNVAVVCGLPLEQARTVMPIFEWVKGVRIALTAETAAIWQGVLVKRPLVLTSDIEESMRLEREFRFSGLVVPLIAGYLRGDPVPLAKPSVKAVDKFKNAAIEMLQANVVLLGDPYLRRAMSMQELPFLRLLNQSLPALVETLENIGDVKKLYPVKNGGETSADRCLMVNIADVFIRCFGDCSHTALFAFMDSIPSLAFDYPDSRWSEARIAEAHTLIKTYDETRLLMDIRYPPKFEEDLLRLPISLSPWLGYLTKN